ncbi:MAG TPA: ParA family protein [Nevskiaceae bacterium]|nr:ParA family protein [Nevskiaceae bacterium]
MTGRPEVWAITNQKGGVGKTTTAVTLAALHAAAGRHCLLIDLDPHASASRYFGYSGSGSDNVLYRAMRDPGFTPQAANTVVDGLTLLPACPELATLGRDSAGGAAGLAIKRLVERLAGVDIIIVDGPPTLGVLMINALVAADRLIVPTLTDPLAMYGVESLDRTLVQIEHSLGRRPPWCIVATQFDRRTRCAHSGLRALEERWGDAVWDETIPIDTQLREASARGLPIGLHAPDSRAARAYRRLYRDLIDEGNHRNRSAA